MEKSRNLEDQEAADHGSADMVVVDREFEVFWESDQDPENPMCWSAGRRWMIVAMVSFITFLT